MAATNISTFNFLLVLFTSVTAIGRSVHICTLAFVPVRRSNNKQRNDKSVSQSYIIRASNPNVSYEYLPPNPDAQPGSFHTPTLKSSYPKGTPAGLRGEAVRSALITTERCIGWDLSTNEESSMGGLLQISGRGTIDFLNGKLTTSIDSNNNNSNNNNNKGGGSGGQKMTSLQDPPPPPLAADVGSSSLQCQLAVENLCVASSQLLSLIRTLRLSILMMDEETIAAEEEWQVLEVQKITTQAQNEANKLEQEWMELRNQEFAIVENETNSN
mmetsp:Transcript_42475/g.43249  ORF Transcript_42475/g.43249 Transcript_42475/m.43249 type:complete len:271 (+) Transcript_42475:27-839(+)